MSTPEPVDRTVWIGAAITLLALSGVCALLGEHLLLGALRLLGGALAGAGAGAAVLALLAGRLRLRPLGLLAGLLAVATALALTVPAVLATRVPPLEDSARAEIAPLGEGDVVHAPQDPAAPVLVRRADGGAELLDGTGVRDIDAAPEDVVALSADGARAVRVTEDGTEVLALDPGLAAPDGEPRTTAFEGEPLALDEEHIVLRHCEDGTCRLAGYGLSDPEEPLWVISDAEETRGTDPIGLAVPARADSSPDLLDAARAAGVLPAVPLRFDAAQGWVQLDPTTGFPVGRLLSGKEQECRIAVTAPTATAQDPLHERPLVLTACSDEDGALTATAHRDGEVLWESAPSPPGTWTVLMDQGRVLATGTEEGTDVEGEIVAAEGQADWIAPGGEGVAQAAAFSSRIGIDGVTMVVTNESGQVVAYDTADGTNTWTLPLSSPAAEARGALAGGTAAVLDPLERTAPLSPRGAQRLRVVDARGGEVLLDAGTTAEVEALHPVGGGRVLLTLEDRTLLLGR
ncbi:outer membrane protein assembly factor BamB family protein [Brachybacterium sp. AOP43-C2-M15]|uniref:outer membrane protein assembly factor BamB family protein n=1 Tax=Brachybacterium sp. AOP43-C2-M15 TaxID=3457661 RepID=UPI0040332487